MAEATVQMRGIRKQFPSCLANDNVDFTAYRGEIHALLGENGAGKSTLMSILTGVLQPDAGEICINGKPVMIRTPKDALQHGIGMIYQHFKLVKPFSVAENIVLSDDHVKVINKKKLEARVKALSERYCIEIDPGALTWQLSIGEQQRVEILKVLYRNANILILDEPTAPLSDTETAELFRLVKHLQETENIAIIFISHRIHEILQICEKYTVMRNGVIVDTSPVTKETTSREIVEKMLGRTFEEQFHKEKAKIGEKAFEVRNLSGADGKVEDVSFYVRKGEIVGIAGLVGAGKSELCKTIFGAYERTSGSVLLGGRELKIGNPSQAVKNGIALVPEERRKEGVLVNENVTLNLSAAALSKFCSGAFVSKAKTEKNAHEYVDGLDIKTPSIRQHVKNLSGGNQQKVAVGKWLAADCDVYIFDEPTKGVDVGAKQDIFRLINDITLRGNSVIYASCENAELLSITDRIYVLFDGRVMAELETAKTDEDEIMHYAVGSTTKYAR